MNSNIKTIVLWLVIIMVVVMLYAVVRSGRGQHETVLQFSELMDDVNAGKIKDVTISGNDLRGHFKDSNDELHSVIPSASYQPLVEAMLNKHVAVAYQKETASNWVSILINAIPDRKSTRLNSSHVAI